MSKEQKIKNFDPNSVASGEGGVFGLPFTPEEAEIVLIPVPWDVTVSYKEGTSEGPRAIFTASAQVDLFDLLVKDSWKIGVAMEKISKEVAKKNSAMRKKASQYIGNLEKGIAPDTAEMNNIRKEVKAASAELKFWVQKSAKKFTLTG